MIKNTNKEKGSGKSIYAVPKISSCLGVAVLGRGGMQQYDPQDCKP